jgi:hypothetical protein
VHRIQVQSTARGVNQGAHIVLSVKTRVQIIALGWTWERGLFRRDMLLVLKWTPMSRVQSVAGEDGMTYSPKFITNYLQVSFNKGACS